MSRFDELDMNAYVDGELSAEQQAEFIDAMKRDPALARQVGELSQLKVQMRLAYADPPLRNPPARDGAGVRLNTLAAGIALLTIGVIGGWFLHATTLPPSAAAEASRFVILDANGRGQAAALADSDETRIVFHLTNADPNIAGDLLDEIESMLDAFHADGRPLRVEVVSHGDGLTLLRDSLSRHKTRIRDLAQRYEQLTFVACRNTIERLRIERGIEVRLLPDAEVTDSGVSHVVRRQNEGWSYIRA